MASVTVVKTIGTGGDFSTLQLWEDGAPVDLTTAEKSAATTFLVAAFVQGESLTFVGSEATGKLLDTDSTGAGTGTYVTYGITAGNPAASDVVTGGTSGATCVLTSGTADNVGVIWEGQCKNQEFTAASTVITVNGSTSSATAYKKLTTEAGASFRDNVNVQTNALRYNASNGAGIRATTTANVSAAVFTESHCQALNLQFTSDASEARGHTSNGDDQRHENLILEGRTATTSATVSTARFLNLAAKVINVVVIVRVASAGSIVATSTGTPDFFNCTFVCPDDLAGPTAIFQSGASGTVDVQNCGLFAGDSTKAIKTGSATYNFTTCHSDISGTSGVTQVTYSSQFQNVNDATRDYRLKTGAGMIDSGTTDATNAAVDIAGTSRPSGSAYDTGCWEFVQAATGIGARIITGGFMSNISVSGGR